MLKNIGKYLNFQSRTRYLLTYFLMGISLASASQRGISRPDKISMEVGMRLSAFVYQGDLTPLFIGSYKTPRLGIGFFENAVISKSFSIRASIDIGSLKGNDALYSEPDWRKRRNFNFRSSLFEVSSHLLYAFKGNYDDSRQFYPYLFAGAGLSFVNIKRDFSQFDYAWDGWQKWVFPGLNEDSLKKPPRVFFNVPVGIGFKYKLKNDWFLFSELGYRFMFTDYLDGFSRSTTNLANDHYTNFSIGFIFRVRGNADLRPDVHEGVKEEK